MSKKRKNLSATTKVNPPPNLSPPKGDDTDLPFHLMFPVELQHLDHGENKICWFKDLTDMKKYVKRNNLKLKDYRIQITKPKK